LINRQAEDKNPPQKHILTFSFFASSLVFQPTCTACAISVEQATPWAEIFRF